MSSTTFIFVVCVISYFSSQFLDQTSIFIFHCNGFWFVSIYFPPWKCNSNVVWKNGGHFVSATMCFNQHTQRLQSENSHACASLSSLLSLELREVIGVAAVAFLLSMLSFWWFDFCRHACDNTIFFIVFSWIRAASFTNKHIQLNVLLSALHVAIV